MTPSHRTMTARQKDKLIEAAQNAITFTVVGKGAFPLDMLRYDTCWPGREVDSGLVAHDFAGIDQSRTVNLKGLKVPTIARWRSFGWEVIDLT